MERIHLKKGLRKVQVELDDQSSTLVAIVMGARDIPLFGLPWIQAFGLDFPKTVTSTNLNKSCKEKGLGHECIIQLKHEFSELLKDEMETIKYTVDRSKLIQKTMQPFELLKLEECLFHYGKQLKLNFSDLIQPVL